MINKGSSFEIMNQLSLNLAFDEISRSNWLKIICAILVRNVNMLKIDLCGLIYADELIRIL